MYLEWGEQVADVRNIETVISEPSDVVAHLPQQTGTHVSENNKSKINWLDLTVVNEVFEPSSLSSDQLQNVSEGLDITDETCFLRAKLEHTQHLHLIFMIYKTYLGHFNKFFESYSFKLNASCTYFGCLSDMTMNDILTSKTSLFLFTQSVGDVLLHNDATSHDPEW